MSSANKTVELPDGISQDDAVNIVTTLFRENGIKEIQKETQDGVVVISAQTPPSLLSWGEEIQATINKNRVVIESEANQLIDWNKPQKNVKSMSNNIKEQLSQGTFG